MAACIPLRSGSQNDPAHQIGGFIEPVSCALCTTMGLSGMARRWFWMRSAPCAVALASVTGCPDDASLPSGQLLDSTPHDAGDSAPACDGSVRSTECSAGQVHHIDQRCGPGRDDPCVACPGAELCFDPCASDDDCLDPCAPTCAEIPRCNGTDYCNQYPGDKFCVGPSDQLSCT